MPRLTGMSVRRRPLPPCLAWLVPWLVPWLPCPRSSNNTSSLFVRVSAKRVHPSIAQSCGWRSLTHQTRMCTHSTSLMYEAREGGTRQLSPVPADGISKFTIPVVRCTRVTPPCGRYVDLQAEECRTSALRHADDGRECKSFDGGFGYHCWSGNSRVLGRHWPEQWLCSMHALGGCFV